MATLDFLGFMLNEEGAPLVIDGLWDLIFGNGASLGATDRLYFAAGPEEETQGLFGSLAALPDVAQILRGGAGANLLQGGTADDVGRGGAGDDVLRGSRGNDWLNGGYGADELLGGAGNDRLIGRASADTLDGGAGNDVLTGGAGQDLLTGGAGHDRFRFDSASHSTDAAPDRISDFAFMPGKRDRIHLATIDADAGAGGNSAFAFIGTNAFSGVAGELRVEAMNGGWRVLGETDGVVGADLVIEVMTSATPVSAWFVL